MKEHMQSALLNVNNVQGPPGQKGDQGATEIIDYNGNIQEALQVRQVITELISLILAVWKRRAELIAQWNLFLNHLPSAVS